MAPAPVPCSRSGCQPRRGAPGPLTRRRRAGAEGKPLPSELRKEERELRRRVELEDDNTAVPRTHVDDEYAHAGERDPRILITTSRSPSSRLTQFAKELKLVFPNAQRLNRGGQVRSLPPRPCLPQPPRRRPAAPRRPGGAPAAGAARARGDVPQP